MKIISFNPQTGSMAQWGKTAIKPQAPIKTADSKVQFGRHDRDRDSFQRNNRDRFEPSRSPSPAGNLEDEHGINVHDPEDRENLIESILEDLENEPELHTRLTNIRTEHPHLQTYSEQNPEGYIAALRDIVEIYENSGLAHANRAVNQLIQAGRH